MKRLLATALALTLLIGGRATAQSVTFDFEDGTDQGWGPAFSDGPDGNNDVDASFPIVDIAGSKRMQMSTGAFQAGSIRSNQNPYLAAMNASTANPSVATISYDWYVDTSGGGYGSFLQLGTYINSGQSPFSYVQSFPEAALTGDQLSSGAVFSGTVTGTFTAKYGALPADFLNAPFQRFGLIVNGDGASARVYFDNITINAVPEPAALALAGLAVPALAGMVRKRRK